MDTIRAELYWAVRVEIRDIVARVCREGEIQTRTLERMFRKIDPVIKQYYAKILDDADILESLNRQVVRRLTNNIASASLINRIGSNVEMVGCIRVPVLVITPEYTGEAYFVIRMDKEKGYGELVNLDFSHYRSGDTASELNDLKGI